MDIEQRPGYRLATALVGLALLGVAAAAFWISEAELGFRVAVGLAGVALGVDALRGAWRGRACLISRIGPLP